MCTLYYLNIISSILHNNNITIHKWLKLFVSLDILLLSKFVIHAYGFCICFCPNIFSIVVGSKTGSSAIVDHLMCATRFITLLYYVDFFCTWYYYLRTARVSIHESWKTYTPYKGTRRRNMFLLLWHVDALR